MQTVRWLKHTLYDEDKDFELTILRSDGPTILGAIPNLVARMDLARRCLFVEVRRQPSHDLPIEVRPR